jgi:hypothetical protein
VSGWLSGRGETCLWIRLPRNSQGCCSGDCPTAGAENVIRPGQATSRYSWITTEDDVAPAQLRRLGITDRWWSFHRERGQLTQPPMRPVLVVVGHVFGQDPLNATVPA